jgi:hypothetical protein
MRLLILIAPLASATVAHAHVGDHTHLPVSGVLAHLLETEHVILATLAIAIGATAIGAYKLLRLRAATFKMDKRP